MWLDDSISMHPLREHNDPHRQYDPAGQYTQSAHNYLQICPQSWNLTSYHSPSHLPSHNTPLKQPHQLIQPLNNNMRPLIHFQLLFTRALDQHRQSSCVVARDDVVDAVADHDQWQLLPGFRMRTRSADVDAPCFSDV